MFPWNLPKRKAKQKTSKWTRNIWELKLRFNEEIRAPLFCTSREILRQFLQGVATRICMRSRRRRTGPDCLIIISFHANNSFLCMPKFCSCDSRASHAVHPSTFEILASSNCSDSTWLYILRSSRKKNFSCKFLDHSFPILFPLLSLSLYVFVRYIHLIRRGNIPLDTSCNENT